MQTDRRAMIGPARSWEWRNLFRRRGTKEKKLTAVGSFTHIKHFQHPRSGDLSAQRTAAQAALEQMSGLVPAIVRVGTQEVLLGTYSQENGPRRKIAWIRSSYGDTQLQLGFELNCRGQAWLTRVHEDAPDQSRSYIEPQTYQRWIEGEPVELTVGPR